MARAVGCFLLAFAALMLVVCGIGTLVALGELPRVGAGMLIAFVALDLVAVALLVGAVIILRRTKPWVGPVAGGAATDHYPANTATTHDLDGVAYSVLYTPPVKGK